LTEENDSLGEYMQAKRLERGYSLRQLSQLSGIPHPTIKKIENDIIAIPGPSVLVALIDALHLDIIATVARIEPYRILCQRVLDHYQARQQEGKKNE
jgi:transcriptional regulator with XRE-family HTH domain